MPSREQIEQEFRDFRVEYAAKRGTTLVDSILIPRVDCFQGGYEKALEDVRNSLIDQHPDTEAGGVEFCGKCGKPK